MEIDNRLQEMCQMLRRHEYNDVIKCCKETLGLIHASPHINTDHYLWRRAIDAICLVRCDVSVQQYAQAHNRLRDLHYAIYSHSLGQQEVRTVYWN